MLAVFEVALCGLLKRREILLCQIEKRAVVVAQCIGRQCFESVGKFFFCAVYKDEFLLVCSALVFEASLQSQEVRECAGILTAQTFAFIGFAIECITQLAHLILFTGETLDQRGPFSFTVGTAAFEFVSEFCPGYEPEGESADDQAEGQHRHRE